MMDYEILIIWKEEMYRFTGGLKLQLLLILKTLHFIIPFEMALDYIIYDTFNDILT